MIIISHYVNSFVDVSLSTICLAFATYFHFNAIRNEIENHSRFFWDCFRMPYFSIFNGNEQSTRIPYSCIFMYPRIKHTQWQSKRHDYNGILVMQWQLDIVFDRLWISMVFSICSSTMCTTDTLQWNEKLWTMLLNSACYLIF